MATSPGEDAEGTHPFGNVHARQARSWAWLGYLAVGLVGVALYFRVGSLPGLPSWVPHLSLYLGIHVSTVVALVVGIWRWRPARPLGWWLLVANQVVYTGADVVFYLYRDILNVTTFPSVADVLYLGSSALFVAALLVFIHQRGGHDRAAALDSAIVGLAAATVSWVLVIGPTTQSDLPPLVLTVSLAYPVLDLAMATLAARLLVGPSGRSVSFYLLCGGLVLLVVNDTVYGWMQLQGTYHTGAYVDGGWLVFYLCVGAAALHPSMRQLNDPHASHWSWSGPRLAALTLATLVAPSLFFLNLARDRHGDDVVIVTSSAVTFLLVLIRMRGLMREQEATLRTNQEQHAALQETMSALQQAQTQRASLLGAVVNSAENERIRVAAELHDGPIQHLSSIAYAIDRAHGRFNSNQTTKGLEILQTIRDQVSGEITNLRRLMSHLRPPVLDQGGLATALRDHVADFRATHGIACDLETALADDSPIDPEIETVIYRVTQEALTNVARHSGAQQVLVRLFDSGDGLELSVTDDGRGFDTAIQSQRVRDGHFGLLGMRERVEGAGGRWQVRSSAGAGTTARATVPRRLPGEATPRFDRQVALS